MKKYILIIAIAMLGMAATAQVDSTGYFTPNYGIELLTETVTYSDGTVIESKVTVQPPRFLPNMVVFYFDTERFNPEDSVYLKPIRNKEGCIT